MTTFDRYVLKLFFKVTLICVLSITGLFIVIDLFEHLEEFLAVSKTEGGMLSVAAQHYVPRALTFFDQTSGILALTAAIFVITLIKRSRELEAILAGGVPLSRVVRPLFIGVVIIAGLSVANRELFIPKQKDRLVREMNNWKGENESGIRPRYDFETDIFIAGKGAIAGQRRIVAPIFQLPTSIQGLGEKLLANDAIYLEGTKEHQAGYLLRQVSVPENPNLIPSAKLNDRLIVLTAKEHSWLDEKDVFVVSNVDFDRLSETQTAKRYASTASLITGLHNPSLNYGATTRVTIHSRIVQPWLDVALLFVGIPIVLSRKDRNVFVAIGLALTLLACFFLFRMAAHGLGTYGVVRPVTAAWLPLIVLGPFAWISSRDMR